LTGCPTLTAPVAHSAKMFVAALSLANGTCDWAKSFGSDGGSVSDDHPHAIAIYGNGVAVVGSTDAPSWNFFGQDLDVPSPFFLAIFASSNGDPLYSFAWGGAAKGNARGVVTDQNDLWVAGWYQDGQLDVPGLPAVGASEKAAYVLHFPASVLP
jgi:hypothetical protein